ncbi:putative PIF1 DNA helicase/replication protein A1-like protein [Tanacetum coccineum]
MNNFSGKRISTMGYQKTPGAGTSGGGSKGYRKGGGYGGYGSSKGFCVSGSSGGGEDSNKKITPISEVDPMLDNIAVQGRCISIWHSHRLNAAHDPYSLDLVLQDAQNNRIQVYIKKEFMFRFEPLFEEGQCYTVSNFGIAENGGRLPLLPHRYKISFYKSTIVTRIEPFDNNTHGFVLEPYNRLLDPEHHQYYEQDAVDVIGSVVGIGDIVPVMSAAGKKVRRTVVTEDAEGNRLDFTFWDNWATMWDEYAMNREALGHVVFILQLGKVKYWDGTPAIHNALFGSKIFINRDLPEIAAFRTRVQDREGYDANQLMIQHVAPEVKVVTVAEFFHRSVKKMVGGIRECDPVIVRLIDESGSAPVVFFNTNFYKLSKHTAWELMEKYGMDTDDYFPEDLDEIVGKKYLFKVYFSEYNCNNNNHTYRCDGFSDDVGFIKHFKKGFLTDEADDEQADAAPDEEANNDFTTPSTLIKKVNMHDSSVNRVLDMETPSKDGSGSGESSGVKKRRVFIDLDELDTESEDEEGNSNTEDFVKVKVEPEDFALCLPFSGYCQKDVGETSKSSLAKEKPIEHKKPGRPVGRKPLGVINERSTSSTKGKDSHGEQRPILTSFEQNLKGKMVGRKTPRCINFTTPEPEDYIDHGDPRFECTSCGAMLWFAEKNRGASNTNSDSYSLCCMRGRGPYCYRLHGENKHRIGDLLPEEGKPPKFCQLYIYDTENEIRNRMQAVSNGPSTSSSNNELDYQLTTDIRDMLDSNINWLFGLIGRGDEETIITTDVLRISELHVLYLALQYPLFFPYAEDGYRTDVYHEGVNLSGMLVVLPSSFTGSPRYMMQNYLDAMTVCKFYGYPDLFITFTCNPNWPKIAREVSKKGLKPEDRPDVITRVFKIKLDSLIKEFKDERTFGRVRGVVYTIEFQKRGLPHCHILLWLEEEDKLTTPSHIDKYISAEIPDKEEDPELYQIVKDHMMHGPYGPENPSCPCTVDFKCTKKFPKQFNESTFIDESGYAIYRRRNDGNSIKKNGSDLHNGYVVPYNPGLLRRYQSHINVEWCNQIGSIKYLFKYINKGPDRVTVVVEGEEVDEVQDYYDCRYLSACEAAWRIYGFDIHYRTPSVERLHFIDGMNSLSSLRQQKVRGPMGWDDLKEYDDVVYPTYREACYARGLLEDDKEYVDGLLEARLWGMGDYLRSFLLLLLQDGYCLELSDTQRMNICLTYIEHMLLCNNKSLKSIPGMPYPNQEYMMDGYNRLIYDELAYKKDELREQYQRLYGSLYMHLRSQGEIVLNVASSGIAALLLEGGRTAHSRTLKDICRSDRSTASKQVFGGKVVLFGGDFRQILPVIPNSSRQDVVHATINSSYLWEHCTVLKLTVNMRLGSGATDCERKEIQDFADWILDIGNGNIGGKNDGESTVEFPDNMLIPEFDDHVGDEKIYESSDSVSVVDADDTNFNLDLYTTDFLNTINVSGKIISGGKVGTICAIPRMVITPSDTKMPFKLNRRQFPVQSKEQEGVEGYLL